METFKPQPLEERKSENISFLDYSKDKLFWGFLPIVTGGLAVAFGTLTKWKRRPLDGSPDILTWAYAKIGEMFVKHHTAGKGAEAAAKVFQDHSKGHLIDKALETMGLANAEIWRKRYYNFLKGSEVALPFSAYFLWKKKTSNQLELTEVDNKLHGLEDLKLTDAELAQHNEAMRRELAYYKDPTAAGEGAWQKRVSQPATEASTSQTLPH